MSSEDKLKNIHNEILFVGCLYKQPDMYLKYGEYVRSKYDFSDDITRFFYECFEIMYKTFTQTVNETKLSTFMTQDVDRFRKYNKAGGFFTIKQWQDIADVSDIDNYFSIVKKYSLLREYNYQGYNVDKIIAHQNFNLMTAKDIFNLVRAKVDRVGTVILANEDSVVVNNDMQDVIINCLKSPDIGVHYPYQSFTELFRGIRGSNMMSIGMLSNEGKSRFMTKLCAYIAYHHGENVCVLLNEMTEIAFRYCLLTTVINNKEFHDLHGIEVFKNEREIALGLYIDDNGEFIKREIDDFGEYVESEDAFMERVTKNSEEYRKIIEVSKWIESQQGLLFVKELDAYDDIALEFEIKKHHTIHGVNYFFYDTLKADNETTGDWASLKITATRLKELSNQLNVYMYASIQLVDSAVLTDIFAMSSMLISNSKAIKHVLDSLCYMKRLDKEMYVKYQYEPTDSWGTKTLVNLDPNKIYYGCVIDKNRDGERPVLLFEVDLNRNTWYEAGILKKRV